MRLALLILATLLHTGEWTPVEVTATAYCPGVCCCGPRAVGLTADGTDVADWPYGVAVDPTRIPYGTPIIIPAGLGYLDRQSPEERLFYADDSGGIIRRLTRSTGRVHVDLRFRQHRNAALFGRKNITILVWSDQ